MHHQPSPWTKLPSKSKQFSSIFQTDRVFLSPTWLTLTPHVHKDWELEVWAGTKKIFCFSSMIELWMILFARLHLNDYESVEYRTNTQESEKTKLRTCSIVYPTEDSSRAATSFWTSRSTLMKSRNNLPEMSQSTIWKLIIIKCYACITNEDVGKVEEWDKIKVKWIATLSSAILKRE